jgi:transposase
MTRRPPTPQDTKTTALRAAGALHPHPDTVQDEAFLQHEFFDRRDRVQVKYEMLRRHRVEGQRVTQVAIGFGVSRQAFYTAEAAFKARGIPGLLPRRRGPKQGHKCTDEVLDFSEKWRSEESADRRMSLVEAIKRRFGVTIHPRSLDRALARRKKRRGSKEKQG